MNRRSVAILALVLLAVCLRHVAVAERRDNPALASAARTRAARGGQAGGTAAQDRSRSPDPAFEVVSVKANPNDDAREGLAVQPDGSVRFTAFPVRTLITMAYRSEGIQRFDQLVGAPSWIAADRFDVIGRTGAGTGAPAAPNQLPAMLRSLLRDRFGLRLHVETRSMRAYRLVVTLRDGKLGPRLRESTGACPDGAANQDPARWCGIRAAGGLLTGRHVSMALLAGNLSGNPAVDRFVTDRTQLTGRYDFELEYSPAFLDAADPGATSRPSLFTALTEQLGVTLEAEMLVVPVLVIDNIERPSPD